MCLLRTDNTIIHLHSSDDFTEFMSTQPWGYTDERCWKGRYYDFFLFSIFIEKRNKEIHNAKKCIKRIK